MSFIPNGIRKSKDFLGLEGYERLSDNECQLLGDPLNAASRTAKAPLSPSALLIKKALLDQEQSFHCFCGNEISNQDYFGKSSGSVC